jgi:hypothetical protein
MTIALLAILGCVAAAFVLLHRAAGGGDGALVRLALLHGIERIWGESEDSLRNRTAGAARWPYSRPAPEFLWWARAWHRMIGALRRRQA